nr:MAG TPA: HlyD family secretion protein [Caudoviricetes sp.]
MNKRKLFLWTWLILMLLIVLGIAFNAFRISRALSDYVIQNPEPVAHFILKDSEQGEDS